MRHPSPRSRLLAALAALAGLTGLTALVAAAPPAQAAAPSYVALGDSYASGTGTRSYVADGTSCQRSTLAYPSLIAAQRGYALNFRACSGARIPEVQGQLGALSTTTSFVTVSVGGNDAGFADVLTDCALPFWAADCNRAVDGAQAFIAGTLPARLSSLYAAVRAGAPHARVVVVGYPRVFNGEDCNALTFFSAAEMTRLNATADRLNGVLATAASRAGFGFANPTGAFVSHAVCDDAEWLNGLSNPISESFHPNRAGHTSGYLPTVARTLTGTALALDAGTRQAALASAGEIAASQAPYAAADSSVEPETFVVPDLRSPEVRAAARAAGIDLERWIRRHT